MKITWGWEDGYVKQRPDHTVEIPDEDLEGLSERQREDYIDEYIRQEFDNKVTYYWKVKP